MTETGSASDHCRSRRPGVDPADPDWDDPNTDVNCRSNFTSACRTTTQILERSD